MLQTSWSTRRAQPRGAWCRGRRWSSWRWGTAREVWMKEGQSEWKKRGKREKTDRERTDTLLSIGVNKRDLSSQSFAVCTQAMGDPWMCMCVCNSPTNLRALTHNPVSCSVKCVCVYIYLYVAQLGHLSIEKDWSFHGTWGVLVSMSRLGAKLWHRGRGESLQPEECWESGGF